MWHDIYQCHPDGTTYLLTRLGSCMQRGCTTGMAQSAEHLFGTQQRPGEASPDQARPTSSLNDHIG